MVSPLCPQVIYFGTIATRVVGDVPDAVVTVAAFDCAQLPAVLHGLLAKHLASEGFRSHFSISDH